MYFLLALIAIGVLILSDTGKTILYVIAIGLLIAGVCYGIFYGILLLIIFSKGDPFEFDGSMALMLILIGGLVVAGVKNKIQLKTKSKYLLKK